MTASRKKYVLLLGDPPDLSGLAREVTFVKGEAAEIPEGDGKFDAAWVNGGAPQAAQAAGRLVEAGIPTVLSSGEAPDVEGPLVVGGPGIGSLALATLAGGVRAEALGRLRRLAIRLPGGRRVRPAASKRTAFDRQGRVDWDLPAPERARLAALVAPYFRAAEIVLPGSLDGLAIHELIGGPKARLVAHAKVNGVSVEVEIDEEVRGDEAWEVEATCARGSFQARFSGERGILLTRAPLRRDDSEPDRHSPDELLLRHVLASGGDPKMGEARTARRARSSIEAALSAAPSRLASRPLDVVLVHVPRYRNRHDDLSLPSLGVARLQSYLRGYGFEVRVADLEAMHADVPLEVFTDDARVDAWLEGGADTEIEERLEILWPELAEAARGRCLVGFSVVDYYGHFQMNLASCLARRVRERFGHPTVLGGERDQVDAERALRPSMPFDQVVDGDGEEALHALACLHAYDDRHARDVRAVWSRDGDEMVKNRIVRSHLNAMPRPSFDGIPLERYRRAPNPHLVQALRTDGNGPAEDPAPFLYLPYGFVKGCVAECRFCSAKEHLDVQAPEKTVDELLALSERHDVRDFVFLNNLVNLSPKWLRKFCERLIDSKAGLQWTDSCRPTGIDPELAHLMRAAGCLLLNFGAESGSDAILEGMKKGLRRADIETTLAATHEAGILNRVNLIAGYFHESEADVDLTVSLVEELSEAIDVIGCFQGFYLFPGMGVDPEAVGIELREGLGRLETGQATLMYDEIGGLPWEAKRARIDTSRNRIMAAIEGCGIRTVDKIDEYDLFWISRTFRDKALTKRYVLRPPMADYASAQRAALLPGGSTGRVS